MGREFKPNDSEPTETTNSVLEVFQALSHPVRLEICQLLMVRQYSVGELCETLGLKQYAEIVRWPDHYIDGRGADIWSFIQSRLGEEAA